MITEVHPGPEKILEMIIMNTPESQAVGKTLITPEKKEAVSTPIPQGEQKNKTPEIIKIPTTIIPITPPREEQIESMNPNPGPPAIMKIKADMTMILGDQEPEQMMIIIIEVDLETIITMNIHLPSQEEIMNQVEKQL